MVSSHCLPILRSLTPSYVNFARKSRKRWRTRTTLCNAASGTQMAQSRGAPNHMETPNIPMRIRMMEPTLWRRLLKWGKKLRLFVSLPNVSRRSRIRRGSPTTPLTTVLTQNTNRIFSKTKVIWKLIILLSPYLIHTRNSRRLYVLKYFPSRPL